MRSLLASLAAGCRILLLAGPRGARARIAAPAEAGPAVFFALCLADLLLAGLFAGIASAPPWRIAAEGILGWLAQIALLLAASWTLVRLAGRERLLWQVATWLAAALLLVHLASRAAACGLFRALDHAEAAPIAAVIQWAVAVWWFVAACRLARRLGAQWPQAILGAAASCLLLGLSWQWLPQPPPLRSAAVAEASAAAEPDGAAGGFDAFSPEQVLYAQPHRLDEALERLATQRPGMVDLYVIAFAGDGTESVFRNEVEHVERLFSERFDAAGRVLTLINHPATVDTVPLATLTNLTWAIDGVAARMDPQEDILLVFLTSHGSEDHRLYVDLPPLPLDAIGPAELADALDATPRPRWRVVIVSACYSGGFIDALRDDATLVITAARADRTSFGCGADADITYFGRAFLDEALNHTAALPEAFELAREAIAQREHADGIDTPSEPQIATAPAIEARLARWRQQITLGPAVPFVPGVAAGADTKQPHESAPGDAPPSPD